MENLEILKNIKDYMQWCIDRGYHKFTYNDLGRDFKCIDAINLIDDVLNHITKQEKMIDIMINMLEDYSADEFICNEVSKMLFKNNEICNENCKECIKQYFEKKAEENK